MTYNRTVKKNSPSIVAKYLQIWPDLFNLFGAVDLHVSCVFWDVRCNHKIYYTEYMRTQPGDQSNVASNPYESWKKTPSSKEISEWYQF